MEFKAALKENNEVMKKLNREGVEKLGLTFYRLYR